MYKKIKNKILKFDRFLYQKFDSYKSFKYLQNIKEVQTIFSHLNEPGKENRVRFVGGCIRKTLCGEEIKDIDLATSLEPNEIKEILNNKKIKVIETGISHGTVTAVVNEKKFEITTLREDVATDGRHANVQFTKDWYQDSLRRDFTINAIYVDIEGRIFDPQNGISDLENGKIKFIGTPEDRIQEDYLRILRYFRFFTNYSKVDHDESVIKLIKQNINGLNKISNERVFDELNKILRLVNINDLFTNNVSIEIILNIFPQFKYYKRLKILNKLSLKLKEKYDNYLILALLIVDDSDNYEYFCHKYKTSNNLKNKFKNIKLNFESLKNKSFYSEENIKKIIYFSNKNFVRDLLLFSICSGFKVSIPDIEKLINYVDVCQVPKFPFSGDYLKEHGYSTGKTLGKQLKILEEKWVKSNFLMKRKELEKSLSKLNKD